ncbi:MAG TPA: helix-turn-helix domain-containing protein [Candidatus Sulfotelmatobacter sp.]|nr:helix-turn-helix domain-containing protein [Candidatus Sulfotelmatobacter sp.]
MPRHQPSPPLPDPEAPPRRVVFAVFPDFQVLDLTGPLAVFYNGARTIAASRRSAAPAYRTEVVAARAGRVDCQQSLGVFADLSFAETKGPIDTLIVAGGSGVHQAVRDGALTAWLRRTAPNVRRLCSVCTGAFALAAAGLLDGKRATTHWASCQRLAESYPTIAVEPDSIYVRDGNTYTSAGVTAGMDLALALVEEDFGRDCAITAARWLVLFAKRPGGQSQFSTHLAAQAAEREPVRRLQEWILAHLGADLSVAALADHAGMSPRNFARVFRRETGATPADFVEAARIDAARRRLEETGLPVERVAGDCGFSTAEHMRRAFHRRLGASPQQYRARFQSPVVAAAE